MALDFCWVAGPGTQAHTCAGGLSYACALHPHEGHYARTPVKRWKRGPAWAARAGPSEGPRGSEMPSNGPWGLRSVGSGPAVRAAALWWGSCEGRAWAPLRASRRPRASWDWGFDCGGGRRLAASGRRRRQASSCCPCWGLSHTRARTWSPTKGTAGGGGGLAQGLGVGLLAAPTGLSPLCLGLES